MYLLLEEYMKTSKALLKLLVVGCLSVSCALPLTASAEDTSTPSVTQESVVKTELPSGVNRIQLLRKAKKEIPLD